MASLTVFFNKKDRNGNRSVSLRLISDRRQKIISTRVVLSPKEYREYPDGRIKITNNEKYFSVCDFQSDLEKKIYEIETRYPFRRFGPQELYDMITRDGSLEDFAQSNFFAWADEWLERQTIKGKKNYATFLNSLARYNGTRHLPFCAITVKFLRGYSDYLGDKARARTLYLGAFRHIYRQAALENNSDDKIVLSPYLFERFKVPRQRCVGQRAIGLDDLRRFFEYTPAGKRETLAHDCALLSFCMMGTNSADLFHMEKFDGSKVCYRRRKTKDRRADGAYIEIDVDPIIRPLMEKYRGDSSHVFSFWRLFCDEAGLNASINKGLKQIGAKLGMECLQFYAFRHSWATVARNECGIDRGVVDSALNHLQQGNELLDIYVKKDFRGINRANKAVIDLVFRR